jgi:hypothetical protein
MYTDSIATMGIEHEPVAAFKELCEIRVIPG